MSTHFDSSCVTSSKSKFQNRVSAVHKNTQITINSYWHSDKLQRFDWILLKLFRQSTLRRKRQWNFGSVGHQDCIISCWTKLANSLVKYLKDLKSRAPRQIITFLQSQSMFIGFNIHKVSYLLLFSSRAFRNSDEFRALRFEVFSDIINESKYYFPKLASFSIRSMTSLLINFKKARRKL